MIYIRTFQNHSEYEDYLASTDFSRPNVSHCISQGDVHYNPYLTPQVIRQMLVEYALASNWDENYPRRLEYINTNPVQVAQTSEERHVWCDDEIIIPSGQTVYGIYFGGNDPQGTHVFESDSSPFFIYYIPELDKYESCGVTSFSWNEPML